MTRYKNIQQNDLAKRIFKSEQLLDGQGPPDPNVGELNDKYVDLITGLVYKKVRKKFWKLLKKINLSSSGLSSVATDATLTGDGTVGDPLSVVGGVDLNGIYGGNGNISIGTTATIDSNSGFTFEGQRPSPASPNDPIDGNLSFRDLNDFGLENIFQFNLSEINRITSAALGQMSLDFTEFANINVGVLSNNAVLNLSDTATSYLTASSNQKLVVGSKYGTGIGGNIERLILSVGNLNVSEITPDVGFDLSKTSDKITVYGNEFTLQTGTFNNVGGLIIDWTTQLLASYTATTIGDYIIESANDISLETTGAGITYFRQTGQLHTITQTGVNFLHLSGGLSSFKVRNESDGEINLSIINETTTSDITLLNTSLAGGTIALTTASTLATGTPIAIQNTGTFPDSWTLTTVSGAQNTVLTMDASKNAVWGTTVDSLGGQQTALTAADATATDGTIGTNDTITNNLRTRINELETKLQALGLLA